MLQKGVVLCSITYYFFSALLLRYIEVLYILYWWSHSYRNKNYYAELHKQAGMVIIVMLLWYLKRLKPNQLHMLPALQILQIDTQPAPSFAKYKQLIIILLGI